MPEAFKSEPAVSVNVAETKAALAADRVPEPQATRWTKMFEALERSDRAMAAQMSKLPEPTPEVAARIAEAKEKYGKVFNQIVESEEERDALEALLDAAGISHSRTVVEYDEEQWEMEQSMREEDLEIQQLEEHFKL